MSMRAAAEGKLHYVVSPPWLVCQQGENEGGEHSTKHTNSHVPAWFYFFFVSQLCWHFFFFARDNAEVITAPSGTSTKQSIITKFCPLSKFTQYDGAQTTQVAHQWKGSLMWLQLPSVPMITNGGVCAALITHSAAQRNAVAEVLMPAHLQRR